MFKTVIQFRSTLSKMLLKFLPDYAEVNSETNLQKGLAEVAQPRDMFKTSFSVLIFKSVNRLR